VSLEDRLSALAVEWPQEPDVAGRVRARLEARPRRRWPRLAIPFAVLVLVAAVPPARSTVLDWLGLGGETIQRVPKVPTPTPVTVPLDLGTRVPLPRSALVPRALGRPDAVYEAGDIVTLLYRPRRGLPESEYTGAGALVSEFPGRTNAGYVRKMAGPHTRIDRVTVGGEPGFWIAGAAHGLLYEDPSGAIGESRPRLAGQALVWRHGARTLRLEADIAKSRALAIARSVR
jgi:hypothetical protein